MVLLIKVVGLILVLALLTLPAAIAAHWAKDMLAMVAIATLNAVLAVGLGMMAAVYLDWPAGPTMILAAASLFGLSMLLQAVRFSGAERVVVAPVSGEAR